MQSYEHFTLVERETLRIKLQEGKSLRQIAKEMGRSPSTLSREYRRNGKKDGGYNAWWACSMYLYRRKRCVRTYRLDADPELLAFTLGGLSKYWSPQIITAKWKQLHPNAKLSASTLYAALKGKRLDGCSEHMHLLRRGKRKFCSHHNPVKPQHSIHQRSEQIELRQRIGDWEGDTIRGGLGKGYIFTCIDRKSRYLTLSLLTETRTPQATNEAICKALDGLPRHSLTLDNGTEFAHHQELERMLDTTIYFADPHSPWQRGSNENINGMLRFFFPKGADFRLLSQYDLDHVCRLLNDRPRKCLGWLSPLDVFSSACCT